MSELVRARLADLQSRPQLSAGPHADRRQRRPGPA